MDFTKYALEIFKDAPTFISVGMSMITLGLLFFYHKRKNDIEEKGVEGSAHKQQIEVLMQQIELLSEELTQARTQLAQIHEQNIRLMEQLRKANIRISELEVLLASRQFRETVFGELPPPDSPDGFVGN